MIYYCNLIKIWNYPIIKISQKITKVADKFLFHSNFYANIQKIKNKINNWVAMLCYPPFSGHFFIASRPEKDQYMQIMQIFVLEQGISSYVEEIMILKVIKVCRKGTIWAVVEGEGARFAAEASTKNSNFFPKTCLFVCVCVGKQQHASPDEMRNPPIYNNAIVLPSSSFFFSNTTISFSLPLQQPPYQTHPMCTL